jgi:aryl-alcohol dehydrogenase-like predicted oxidoreductase
MSFILSALSTSGERLPADSGSAGRRARREVRPPARAPAVLHCAAKIFLFAADGGEQQMALPGHATTEGTARYRERFAGELAEKHFHFEHGLWLSSIGVGTYLGDPDDETDRSYADAVARAVALGANVLDTAANYRHQRSERAIGAALEQLTGAGGYGREEVVICTKGGYLPFDAEAPAGQEARRRYVSETFVESGLAAAEEIVGGHCMAPRYLAHQVAQSLGNMRLEAIDVYYIHNPEAQLQRVAREEFERRLLAAFAQLEREREAGRLRFYGAATWNGFRAEPQSRSYHSLGRMVELAREAGGDAHGFRFVQLPFNLAMPEALTEANHTYQNAEVSLLEAARAFGVAVVASASLKQGAVARGLPDHVREALGGQSSDALTALQFVRSTPGITTALVGMSRRAHVEENLGLARREPASAADYSRLFTFEGE